MNNQNKLILAASAVTILNFNSCSKYEEGPAFSLIPKNNRLVGEWELVKMDGENIEDYFNNLYGGGYYGSSRQFDEIEWIWDFEKDQDLDQDLFAVYTISYNYGYTTYSYTDTINQSMNMSTWEWEDKKAVIEIETSYYGSSQRTEYEVLKLTSSEMKIKDINDVEMEFEKK